MSCCQLKKQNYPEVVSIDNLKLRSGDVESVTLLAFALNPIEFEKRLSVLGIRMGDYLEDIKALAKLHDMKGDVNGIMMDSNDNRIVFNLVDFIKDIPTNDSPTNPIKLKLI